VKIPKTKRKEENLKGRWIGYWEIKSEVRRVGAE